MGGAILLDYEEFNGKSYVPSETYDEVVCKLRGTGDRIESQKKEIKDMQAHIDCLKTELSDVQTKQSIYDEPIRVAGELIHATGTGKDLFGKEYKYNIFSESELRQIAEHLLVYCNNCEDREQS